MKLGSRRSVGRPGYGRAWRFPGRLWVADVRAGPLRLRVEAATEGDPPYRLRQLRLYPLERKVKDPRVAAPPTRTSGAVPPEAAGVAADSFTELGLVGLIVAGAIGDGSVWVTARGWANLDHEPINERLIPPDRLIAGS